MEEFQTGQYVVFNNSLHIYICKHPTMKGCYNLERSCTGENVAAHNLCVVAHKSVTGNNHFSKRLKKGSS